MTKANKFGFDGSFDLHFLMLLRIRLFWFPLDFQLSVGAFVVLIGILAAGNAQDKIFIESGDGALFLRVVTLLAGQRQHYACLPA